MDKKVLEIAEAPLEDASEIAARFRALMDVIPPTDGIRRFCQVHEVMSEAVTARLDQGGFLDPDGLERMDIHLVGRFFTAVAQWERDPERINRAWAPVFERRANTKIHPIQFALAGIHAHIASDLVFAVLRTHEERGLEPELDTELHKDFCEINNVEGPLRDVVEAKLAGPEWQEWDKRLGPIDDWLEQWSFSRARDKAWLDAMVIGRSPRPLASLHLGALDRTTGFANRIFLR